jgi:predicted transposase YdaD
VERLRELLALIAQIRDLDEATEIVYALLHYYVQANSRLDEQEVRTLLHETPFGETLMQTFIDRYREQGRQEGRQEGWQEGRQEGEAAVLLRLMERKFGPPGEAVRQRIAQADAETLLRWSERVLTADSLEAVLH